MIKLILISSFFVFINGDFETESLCGDHNATSKSIIDYCISQNGSLKFRCCFLSNSSNILAIDLTEMKLNKVPDLKEFTDLTNLTMVDLRLNPQLESSTQDDFFGMLSLDYLYLPEQYPCPGEKHAWQSINQTIDPKGILCMYQKDVCINSTNFCVEPNSYCATNGPNHFFCLCKTGYYGYKCLRHGQFPMGKFFGISITTTIVLSIFFFWTQRRHVKKD
ncbi:unnamed protein product [Rotaria socialis]|uniref:EGF-like domain-containing protein n=1 Tax=Rotaria socialis TaxID=392032 RepID=A0A820L4U9_9BILA|nr:unnamed protein product [Rotaria socialis]CAF3319569.1 unnamed protein product [Rotaria socialis]CAF3330321.1 unnamed protein product [Rotaria socialis]CAF3355895.1 unnamed protein product [Rotaria socialis]CAF3473819.1 unnamed protein product [Rotaria socialis]